MSKDATFEPGETYHVEDTTSEIETVEVHPAEGKATETAQALLDAADDVRDVLTSDGIFIVPKKVADRAKLPEADSKDSTQRKAAVGPTLSTPAPARAGAVAPTPEPPITTTTPGDTTGDTKPATKSTARKTTARKSTTRTTASRTSSKT